MGYAAAQLHDELVSAVCGGTTRTFHLNVGAHVDEVVEITLTQEHALAECAGEKLGGRLAHERSFPRSRLQHAEKTRLFTASRIVDRPTSKRIANSFSDGIRSPGFHTRFMIRSVNDARAPSLVAHRPI